MKKIIALLSVLLPLCISAQVSFSFEDGSAGGWIFNAADRWNTDNVNPLNGLYSLHHVFDNSEAATDVAVFSIAGLCPDCSETTWEFTVRHGADPSSSNKWSFILASDTGTDGIITGAGFSGFAAGVNFSGYDDTLRLWHILEGKVNVLISTEVNWQNDIGTDGVATIKVTRLPGGEWTMLVESWGTEPGAWGMEHGAGSVKKGAWSKEHEEKGKEGNENSLWKYAGISY
ncbi:MAG TPA: hypothetical protein VMV74_02480, partial [Bacteroidales bacterium]|nr:hypothetical protein [Bacteroidales bacterium]